MQLKQQLVLKLQQKLQLTPQLQLAMKMLQLNHLELSELLKQEVERNPLLEVEAATPTPGAAGGVKDDALVKRITEQAERVAVQGGGDSEFKFDWNAYLRDSEAGWYGERVPARSFDPEEESNIEEYVSSKPSLTEHLSVQLRMHKLSAHESKVSEPNINMHW